MSVAADGVTLEIQCKGSVHPAPHTLITSGANPGDNDSSSQDEKPERKPKGLDTPGHRLTDRVRVDEAVS